MFDHTLRRMMATNHLGTPEHPQVHPVVASAAREVLNKSERRTGEDLVEQGAGRGGDVEVGPFRAAADHVAAKPELLLAT